MAKPHSKKNERAKGMLKDVSQADTNKMIIIVTINPTTIRLFLCSVCFSASVRSI